MSDGWPLSTRQEWFMNEYRRLGSGSLELARYHLAHAITISPTPKLVDFESAINRLVERHAILQWVFLWSPDGDRPLARQAPSAPIFTILDADENDEAFQRRLTTDARREFDLSSGPLFEVIAYRRPGDCVVLLMRVHHLVADGASLVIILRSLLADVFGFGGIFQESEPFSRFVQWQQQMLQGEEGRRLEEFWLSELSDLPAPLALPYDRNAGTGPAVHVQRLLDPACFKAVHQLAEGAGVSAFRLCLAAYVLLIHSFDGADDIPVSLASAARPRREFMNTVGWFSDTLVLRAQIDPGESFVELARRLSRNMDLILEYDGYPLDLIASRLAHLFPGRRSCLDQVAFSTIVPDPRSSHSVGDLLASTEDTVTQIGAYRIETIPISIPSSSRHEISFRMLDRGQKIYLSSILDSARFSRERAAQIVESYLRLIQDAAQDAHIPIRELVGRCGYSNRKASIASNP